VKCCKGDLETKKERKKIKNKSITTKPYRIKSHVLHGEVILVVVNKKTLRKLIFTCREPPHTLLESAY
jgi:hypothetical protein